MQLTHAQAENMRVVKMRNRAKTLVDNCDYCDGYKHRQSLRLERLVEACNKMLDQLSYTLQLETSIATSVRYASEMRAKYLTLSMTVDAITRDRDRLDLVVQRQAEELAKRDLEKHEAELRGREVY